MKAHFKYNSNIQLNWPTDFHSSPLYEHNFRLGVELFFQERFVAEYGALLSDYYGH